MMYSIYAEKKDLLFKWEAGESELKELVPSALCPLPLCHMCTTPDPPPAPPGLSQNARNCTALQSHSSLTRYDVHCSNFAEQMQNQGARCRKGVGGRCREWAANLS